VNITSVRTAPKLSIALQHHPDRAYLLERTAHLEPEIVTDPDPEGIRNPWRTYRLALELTPPGVTHRLVLQDDAETCDLFTEHALLALEARPENIVSFFVPNTLRSGAKAFWQACDRGEAWCVLDWREWVPVVALAWPVEMIPGFLGWCDRAGFTGDRRRADDAIVGRYVREARTQVLATVPSLVEHPDDVESTIGMKKNIPRRALCYWDGVTPISW
jgi:hypothetical protein